MTHLLSLALLVEIWTIGYTTAGLPGQSHSTSYCSASWMAPLQSSADSSLTQQRLCSGSDSHGSFTAGQVSFHQLSKDLLSHCYDDLPPLTQQGFAEPQPP